MLSHLRLMQLNAENLFLYLDRLESEDLTNLSETQWQQLSIASVKNKSLKKTRWLAESISEQDPDVIFLNEVGGPQSLEAFNRHFLAGNYHCLLKEGNSDRGIDIGYLVHKRVTSQLLLLSHKKRSISFQYLHEKLSQKPLAALGFSRDVAELRFFDKQSGNLELVILGVHLKSKLDPEGIDPEGRGRRRAEFETLLKIYDDILEETRDQVPIVVAGDFNGQARASDPDEEFSSIRGTDLVDIFDVCQMKLEERITQFQVTSNSAPIARQIDYIFLSHHLHAAFDHASAKVVHYKNELGLPIPMVQTSSQRYELPSDHFPIQVDLDFTKNSGLTPIK
jgi:endonuclease/exonuclease/phosphatase family metal-dependent hydrolase